MARHVETEMTLAERSTDTRTREQTYRTWPAMNFHMQSPERPDSHPFASLTLLDCWKWGTQSMIGCGTIVITKVRLCR